MEETRAGGGVGHQGSECQREGGLAQGSAGKETDGEMKGHRGWSRPCGFGCGVLERRSGSEPGGFHETNRRSRGECAELWAPRWAWGTCLVFAFGSSGPALNIKLREEMKLSAVRHYNPEPRATRRDRLATRPPKPSLTWQWHLGPVTVTLAGPCPCAGARVPGEEGKQRTQTRRQGGRLLGPRTVQLWGQAPLGADGPWLADWDTCHQPSGLRCWD